MEQLAVLGRQAGIETLPIMQGQSAAQIAKRAFQHASLNGFDVYFLDTAGRLHIDDVLMDEVLEVRDAVVPRETLLVVDGLTGQDAVNVAREFDGKVGISGVVLTRMDGDGRGGAALSMRAITGKPIKFIGTGEKLDALGTFEPERIAARILGMGDIVALVEKAAATLEKEQNERMMRRIQKGQFNMNDLRSQLENMEKMGGLGSIMSMMPGMGKFASQAASAGMDDAFIKRQIALINSMTRKERANPKILQASRKKRIAAARGDGSRRSQSATEGSPRHVGRKQKTCAGRNEGHAGFLDGKAARIRRYAGHAASNRRSRHAASRSAEHDRPREAGSPVPEYSFRRSQIVPRNRYWSMERGRPGALRPPTAGIFAAGLAERD